MYENGKGVEKDATKAVELYRKAAEQGFPRAQFNLGVCYRLGNGTTQNQKLAVEWFQKAAEQKYPYAFLALGSMYQWGEGVEADYSKAETLYRRVADMNLPEGQMSLAVLYLQEVDPFGEDNPFQDLVEAYYWASLAEASAQGSAKQGATRLLKELETKMTSEQLAEAKKRLK